MQSQNDKLQLALITPDSDPVFLECDSLRLTLAEDSHGRGGGSFGIRRGHANAVLALAAGPLTASREGQIILQRTCSAGFARVENNRVYVVTERAAE